MNYSQRAAVNSSQRSTSSSNGTTSLSVKPQEGWAAAEGRDNERGLNSGVHARVSHVCPFPLCSILFAPSHEEMTALSHRSYFHPTPPQV